jgi:hypothetical protein
MATTWRSTSSSTGILIVAVLLSTKYISEWKKFSYAVEKIRPFVSLIQDRTDF